ncbi:hypothetical protein AMATHDRAFT_48288 [Amanita thiersii Skay4041]|uniref:DUF6533 domain-containing protein n=1 Tax=Amanita thiersii Skay4041 TaxID=703135 RepID=A0A2A9NH56_9AGAR|nr:hypothetical protein AMATHDRAFT_48288 [Amanita thiersii Skay4041]
MSFKFGLDNLPSPTFPGMDPTKQVSLSAHMFARSCSFMVSILLQVLEAISALDDEVRYIWSMPFSMIKWIYLFSRYYGLIFQALVFFVIFTSKIPINPRLCHAWAYSRILTFLLFLHILDIVLILRVYALYKKSFKIAVLLSSTFLVQLGAAIGCTIHAPSTDALKLDEGCLTAVLPPFVAGFSCTIVLQQCLIWGLIYAKQWSTSGWLRSGNRILHVVVRDNAWVFLGLSFAHIALVPYAILVKQIAHIFTPPLMSFFSIAICRLILNMQRLKWEISVDEVELTTIYATSSESTL